MAVFKFFRGFRSQVFVNVESLLEQFSAAFEAVPAAVLVVDSEGIIVLANADVNALFGYETGELVGLPIEVLVPPDLGEGHPELRRAYHSLPHRRTMGSGHDLHGVSKTGRLIPVEIGLSSVETSDGVYSVASVLDVSANVAEQERTRSAIDATGSAMILVDDTGTIVLTNSAAHDMFGIEEGQLLGKSIEQLIPERVRRRHVVYRTSYSAEPSVRSMGEGRDLFGLRPDGTEFPVEIGLRPFDHGGERLIMATVLDISERVRADREIRRQNQDLANLNEDLTQFAYSASHDLKAPLTTLQGILRLIPDDIASGSGEEAIENAERARLLAERLSNLIESTLGLAQSESYESVDIEAVDLVGLVDHAKTALEAFFAVNDVQFINRIPTSCRPMVQKTRLRYIIDNLLSNAAKYSDPAKSKRYVEVSADEDDTLIRIRVADNGIGIPEHAGDQVFKRFRRFATPGVEGNGIGLALVKQHVERLDGEITFTSSPEGTTFEVALPKINPSNNDGATS